MDGNHILPDRRSNVGELLGRFEWTEIRPGVGDVLIFDGGRYLHRVDWVSGDRTRWTMGGFLMFDRSGETLFYFADPASVDRLPQHLAVVLLAVFVWLAADACRRAWRARRAEPSLAPAWVALGSSRSRSSPRCSGSRGSARRSCTGTSRAR